MSLVQDKTERIEKWEKAEECLENAWAALWDYTDYQEIKKAQKLIEEAQTLLDFAFQKYGR